MRFAQLAFKAGGPPLTATDLLDRMDSPAATRDLVSRGKSERDKFALRFCSPEMMKA